MKWTARFLCRVAVASAIAWLIFAFLMANAMAQSQAAPPLPMQGAPSQGFPRLPAQQAPQQTLTLPQVAPQPIAPPPGLPSSQRGEEEIRVPGGRQPAYAVASIPITATDDGGRWISDLRKQDVAVYEDGVQRPVLGLQRDFDTPVSIGIVVDTSGSMGWKLPATREALEHFIETINRSDQVFLTAFSNRTFLLQDFTSNVADLDHAIGLLHADGQTALFDAVVQGLNIVEHGRWPKKALLVMTDGMDNVSTNTLGSTIQAARQAGVLIYTVGIGTEGGGGGMMTMPMLGGFGIGFGRPHARLSEDERVDAATLRTLSDETGATTFIINPQVSDLSRLDSYFQGISQELREQYTLRYASAGGSEPHQLRVEGLREGIRVRAPKWTNAGNSTTFPG